MLGLSCIDDFICESLHNSNFKQDAIKVLKKNDIKNVIKKS